MKKINLAITGCMGRMGQQIIKSVRKDKNFKLITLTENKLVNKRINGIKINLNTEKVFKKVDVIVDFTVPKCTFQVLKIASKLKKRVVIGTTGFSQREENLIKKFSKNIPILKAGNMSLGINLLMYLTEIASNSLGEKFLSKVFEVHHKYKKDYPSGTALMLGKGIAKGKNKDLYNLMGKKFLSSKIKYIIVFAIIAALLFDYSHLPFDTNEIIIPEIYDEIKSDNSNFSILDLPLGGHGENSLLSSPAFMFYQTIHEKPIIGGYESRPSNELLENHSNYFLNIFHYASEKDVPEEYLSNSALTNMKKLNIKYVIMHKDPSHISQSSLHSDKFYQEVYIPKMNQIMNIILDTDKPYFEDSNVIVYKIPL